MENINNLPMEKNLKANCDTNCKSDAIEPPKPVAKWQSFADSYIMIAFAVGVYAQIFTFFLCAFTY